MKFLFVLGSGSSKHRESDYRSEFTWVYLERRFNEVWCVEAGVTKYELSIFADTENSSREIAIMLGHVFS